MSFRIPVHIAHETLDGEVVILDQPSGTYFSLTGAGADIWAQVAAGAGEDAIVACCEASFESSDGKADSVRACLAELLRDNLIARVEAAGEAAPAPAVALGDGTRRPWVAPHLERFTDLQTLLLLDPIHDVDESGWPRTAP